MSKSGFDACVVPLLIDMEANDGQGKAIADSAVICNYIVAEAGGELITIKPEKTEPILHR